MPSWHGWDNTPGADIVWRPPSNRRTPFRDRGGDLHKASGFQRASRTVWHRVRRNQKQMEEQNYFWDWCHKTPTALSDSMTFCEQERDQSTSKQVLYWSQKSLKTKKIEKMKNWFYPSNKGTIIDGLILQFELNWKKAYGAKKEKLDASPKRTNFPATIQCFQTTLNFTKQESKCCWYLVLSVKCFNCCSNFLFLE